MRSISASVIGWVVALTASSAAAQGSAPAEGVGPVQTDTITVGIGAGVTTSYDGASDYKLIPGGVLRGTLDGHDFQLNGPQVFVDAVPNDPRRKLDIELGPVAGLRFNRTGKVSDERVAALGKLDAAVEIGARASLGQRSVFHRSDKLAVSITAVGDVAGAHGSHLVTPSIEYSRLVGRRMFVRAALTSEFTGDEYADYNFGVAPSLSGISGLPAYRAKGGLSSLGGNLVATYSLSGGRRGWSLFGVASYKRLQGDIAASPIVREKGNPDQFFGSAGLAYSF